MKEHTFDVYVPARISSTRLPRKALKHFNGKSLILYILETLSNTKNVDRFCVNTESDEIAEVVLSAGFNIYKRKISLAQDNTTTEEILMDYAENIKSDYILAINPTNPLLTATTIDTFIDNVIKNNYDTAFSVTRISKHLLMNGIPVNYKSYGPHPRTQDVTECNFLNWAIVAWKTALVKQKILAKGDSIYLGNVGFVSIPELECFDIDTEFDFRIAESVHKNIYSNT